MEGNTKSNPAYRPTNTIIASGLRGEETEKDIRMAFGSFGSITDVALAETKCYVTFADIESAQNAVNNRRVTIRSTRTVLNVSMKTEQAPPRTGHIFVPNNVTNQWDIDKFVNDLCVHLPEATNQRDIETKNKIRQLLLNYSGYRTGTPQEIAALNKKTEHQLGRASMPENFGIRRERTQDKRGEPKRKSYPRKFTITYKDNKDTEEIWGSNSSSSESSAADELF